MEFSYLTVLAIGSILTLLSTLKLTLTGTLYVGPGKRKSFFFHPLWLWFLTAMLPYVVGRYLAGTLSPLPWAAYARAAAEHGLWGGVLACAATTTIDLWIFWGAAAAFLSFPIPMSVAYEPIPKPLHKYFYLANLLAGAFIVTRALTAGA